MCVARSKRYGYTAAGFSGRMPCAEIADAIVQTGRETLERTIRYVESREDWGAKVVYGDTDSIFVQLAGRSREEAFAVGRDIAAKVTSMNPSPMELELEKIYHPCMLISKKRYVGYSWASPHQTSPTFDAKGIETVRRDSCPLVAKCMEGALRKLFDTMDVSQVRRYLAKIWTQVLAGKHAIPDFIFAKEVRLGKYSTRGALPPAATVATAAIASDPRKEPLYAERVPYVVVQGLPGSRVVDLVIEPLTLLRSQGRLRLHAHYYLVKQVIPALERCFLLFGADVRSWYLELPRTDRADPAAALLSAARQQGGEARGEGGRHTIDAYYRSLHCLLCDVVCDGVVCSRCLGDPATAAHRLCTQRQSAQRRVAMARGVCTSCTGSAEAAGRCESLDCPVFFEREQAEEVQRCGDAINWGMDAL